MATYYKEKKRGDEFVSNTEKLNGYVIGMIMRCPKKWEPYILIPMANTLNEILEKVVIANKIYINEKNQSKEELIKAYAERIDLLIDAIRLFAVFDVKISQLISQIDFLYSERDRLNKILEDLKGDVVVKNRLNEVEYISVSGSQRLTLGVSNKNLERLSTLESNAVNSITYRLNADRKHLKALSESESVSC